MYCWNCGSEVDEKAEICLSCGVKLDKGKADAKPVQSDSSSAGYGVLGFFFPIVGLILWLIWKDDYPNRAKSAGMGALISVAVNVFIAVFIFAVILPLIITGIILL